MNKLIIANWKMNPASIEEARKLAAETDVEGLIICPPFPFLEAVAKTIKKAKLGAQDVFWMNPPTPLAGQTGAYTGEVSAEELKSLCVEYVIIGHSERRQNLGETDEMVAKKIKTVLDAGLTPILCVGETKAEHEAGKTKEIVKRELKIGLSYIPHLTSNIQLVIAYEPIWAIGTGTPDTPENMLNMVKFIREVSSDWPLATRIIYGGSVNSKNAENFLKHKEINGALVGGASLKKEEIIKIVEISKKYD